MDTLLRVLKVSCQKNILKTQLFQVPDTTAAHKAMDFMTIEAFSEKEEYESEEEGSELEEEEEGEEDDPEEEDEDEQELSFTDSDFDFN